MPLPFTVGAPLDKKGAGRYRKLQIKGCLERGSGGKGKRLPRRLIKLLKRRLCKLLNLKGNW